MATSVAWKGVSDSEELLGWATQIHNSLIISAFRAALDIETDARNVLSFVNGIAADKNARMCFKVHVHNLFHSFPCSDWNLLELTAMTAMPFVASKFVPSVEQ